MSCTEAHMVERWRSESEGSHKARLVTVCHGKTRLSLMASASKANGSDIPYELPWYALIMPDTTEDLFMKGSRSIARVCSTTSWETATPSRD
jgi:hypothetical protein